MTTALMLGAAMTSCNRNYHIDGEVDRYGYDGVKLSLLVFDGQKFVCIDSCDVRHGAFQMQGRVDSVRLAVLCNGFEPIMPIFVERGNISVRIKNTELNAEGTRQNNLFYSFLDKKTAYDNRFEDLVQRKNMSFAMNGFFGDFTADDDSIQIVIKESEDYICNFLAKHYKEPVGISVFSMLCDAQPHFIITPLIKRILDEAPESFLKKEYVKRYIQESGYTPSTGE
ncbi:MAG: DUF4369 domain-containing protein [Bacteroidaceae bacterium]|nr:DUF4369 domain-containing protein [Bacteroidaceae bacterium]